MPREALRCIVCSKALENVTDDVTNQPSGGTAFMSHGHYGSTVADFMDGQYLEINVCDPCLKRKQDVVLLGRTWKPVFCHDGDSPFPMFVGRLPVHRELVPWHVGLENEGVEEKLMVEPDEVGNTELYPEIQWHDSAVEFYKHKDGA